MGGSNWHYFTPYQPNVELALQSLRQQEFENIRESYVYFGGKLLTFAEYLPPDDFSDEEIAEYQEGYERYCKDYEERTRKQKPDSIEEMVEWAEADATHSILDIERTGDAVDDLVAAPLSPEQVIGFFGTAHPSRRLIEERERELDEFLYDTVGRRCWQATYIIVYAEVTPSEIYFCGYSGD